MRFLDENRVVLRERLDEESPDWVPAWVDERVFNRVFAGVQSFLADVIAAGRPRAAARLRPAPARLRQRLRTDPATAARVDEAKNQLLDRPDVHDWFAAMWTQLKASVLAESADPRSQLQQGWPR